MIGVILGLSWFSFILSGVFIVFLPMFLFINHSRANKLCSKLHNNWEKSDIPKNLLMKHKKNSLSATNEDIAVIAAMSAALFIGFFSAASNVAGIPVNLALDIPAVDIKANAVTWLSGFVVILILFSSMMIARLRLAVAQFSKDIAEINGDEDNSYSFSALEKTFVLYLLTILE